MNKGEINDKESEYIIFPKELIEFVNNYYWLLIPLDRRTWGELRRDGSMTTFWKLIIPTI